MMTEEKTNTEQSPNESVEKEEQQTQAEEKTTEEKLFDKTEEKKEEAKEEEPKTEEKTEEKEDKPEEKKEEEKKVPEKYELKLPEKSLISDERLEKIESLSKDRGFSNEEAQQVLDSHNDAVEEAIKEYEEAGAENLKELAEVTWPKESEEDKEIGGEKFKENVELAKRVITKYGSEKLTKILNDTGYGNHPELLRVFVNIGKVMADDQLVLGKTQGAESEKSIADKFYGDTTE